MVETAVETEVETSIALPWNVVVHDDPVNLISYVTMVFQRVFGYSKEKAQHHICQLAGNARHAAIGSDLDGGFGTEQVPCGLDRIYELQRLDCLLAARGYPPEDIDAIFHGNWLRFFREHLPR
jgi:hypothetical protein